MAVRTIPDDLYVGWVRILTGSRFGHRIPIDAKDKRPKERFIGSYPNGLDMFFPFEKHVQPLHGSIVHLPQNNSYTFARIEPTSYQDGSTVGMGQVELQSNVVGSFGSRIWAMVIE